MAEPILDPAYWAERLRTAADLHHSIFLCNRAKWLRIEARHRLLLAERIKPNDSVLDCGCGYGRLLTLMPQTWYGHYTGVDISPNFLQLAQATHPRRVFINASLTDLTPKMFPMWSPGYSEFNWAVCISVRPMVIRELGQEVWNRMESNILQLADQILYLEYDENDSGSVG